MLFFALLALLGRKPSAPSRKSKSGRPLFCISCSKLQTPHLSDIRLFPRRFGKATFEAQDFLKDVVSCDRVLINRTARKSALPQFKEIPGG